MSKLLGKFTFFEVPGQFPQFFKYFFHFIAQNKTKHFPPYMGQISLDFSEAANNFFGNNFSIGKWLKYYVLINNIPKPNFGQFVVGPLLNSFVCCLNKLFRN